jgi:hypothetical protein
LQYLVKLVKQNDGSLITFYRDLPHVSEAMNVVLDNLVNDIKILDEDLKDAHETAKVDADRFIEAGNVPCLTLQELKEQKTSVHNVENVPLFNKMDHHTGRTPMERFTMAAAESLNNAVEVVEGIKGKYSGLLRYFGEDESMPSNDFFGTINKFIIEFNAAVEHVEKEEKAKVRMLGSYLYYIYYRYI